MAIPFLSDISGKSATFTGSISSGDITIEDATPVLVLKDSNNGAGGAGHARVLFSNTGGKAIGIGTTGDDDTSTDLYISSNASSTYGGYLLLDTAGISDAQADIIIDPKTNFKVFTAGTLALNLDTSQNATFSGNITAAFDSNNSGNRLRIADTEGVSAAVRTYSTSDGTGLILNHYYAVSGSPYMRYSDFVSNMGDAAATTMRFLTKPHNGNATVALTINNSQNAIFTSDVSINTTTAPIGNLQVVGNAGSAGRIYISDVDEGVTTGKGALAMKSGAHAYYYNRDDGNLYLGTNDDPNKLIITDTQATFSGTVKAAKTFIADAVSASNNDPGTDNVQVSGYGMIGNRANLYVTNANTSSSANVQIGVGGVHNNSPKLVINPGSSIFYTDIKAASDSAYDIGTNATRFANIYADTYYGDGSNLTGITSTDNTKLPLTGGTLTGPLVIDHSSGNSQFTLRFDTTGDSTIIGDVNWNSTGAEGTDDRLGIIRTMTQGGTTSTRGGQMLLYTRIANSSGFNTTTYAQNGQWTFPHHINLSDNKYLMWGGNAILWHTGSYTYVGDNSSSSALSITGGKLGIGGNPSARLHVTIPREQDGTVRNEITRFTHPSENTMSIFAYGGSTDLMQIAAWNNEQNISIVTDTLSSISATSTKGIYIKSGGNVGIGTVTPSQPLSVIGNISTSGVVIFNDGNGINFGNSNAKIYGSSANGIQFNAGGSEKMRFNQSGYLGVGTINPLEKLHVKYADTAGIPTVYSKGLIEDTDAQLDLLSTSDGTWGSSINLVEAAGSDANTDVWSMARKTTGGNGDSSLNFNFGTTNQHNNTTRVAFSSAGNIYMQGDLTVEGGDIYLNDTNTRLTEGNGNAFRITTNSGYGEFGPMNTGHCHIQTDRTNFYFNRQIQVDSGIVSSYNEDLNLRRAVSDAGSLYLTTGAFYSKSVNDSQVQLGGFTINTALEDTYHCYIPGISPNEFAGAHRRLTVTATKNGTSISANSLGPAFLAHEETYSVSTSNTDTIIIEIAGFSLSYGQWYGITFGAAQWRAKDIDIEISTDNGANYTSIYSQNNQPHATVRTYHGGNNVAFNKIKYTLTNWNTTSTRINHIFGYKYLEADTNYLDKFRDESIYGAMNWKDGYPATFGNSGDLVIKHTGSDSIIETNASLAAGDLYIKSQGTNHDLYLQAADDIFIRPQNGESGIKVIGNGQVELYHDNELRLGTTSTGARFTKQQNAGSRLELYNNRQDASNVEVWRIAAYNSVEVTGVHFYRGGGGSSGYTKIFAKKNNASSLEEVVQFGTNDSLLTEFQGDVKVNGDLNITGDINSVSVTNLDVDDKTITIAQGAADSSAADGAGIVVDGASASLLYDHTGTQWEFNKTLEVQGIVKVSNTEANLELSSSHGRKTTLNQGGGNFHIQLDHGTGVGINYGNTTHAGLLKLYNNTTAKVTLNADTGSGDFEGVVTHKGLTMTDGTSVDQFKYFPMTFQLTANTWTDTGIDGTDLATGTYAMQVYVSDFNVGGGHYYEFYSGVISWYNQSTNSTKVDEIVVHRAGHAPNNGDVQFRTQRASGSDTHDLMLQVKHNLGYTAALDDSDGGKIMRFKFRRLI